VALGDDQVGYVSNWELELDVHKLSTTGNQSQPYGNLVTVTSYGPEPRDTCSRLFLASEDLLFLEYYIPTPPLPLQYVQTATEVPFLLPFSVHCM